MKWNFKKTQILSKIVLISAVLLTSFTLLNLRLSYMFESGKRVDMITSNEVKTGIIKEIENVLNKKGYGKHKITAQSIMSDFNWNSVKYSGFTKFCTYKEKKAVYDDFKDTKHCYNSKTVMTNSMNQDFYLSFDRLLISLDTKLERTDNNWVSFPGNVAIGIDVHYKNGKFTDVFIYYDREMMNQVEEQVKE